MPSTPYRKLFIAGCPRSGTTWVDKLIASHPDVVAVPIESHNYELIYEPFVKLPTWDLQRRMQSWKGIIRRYGPKPLLFGFEPVDAWRGILRDYQILDHYTHGLHGLVSYAELKALVKKVRRQPLCEPERAEQLIVEMLDLFFEKNGGDRSKMLSEKTPLNIRYADRLLRLFPESRMIEVVRDGRDVCVSYNALAKRQPWARIGTDGAIGLWRSCVRHGNRFRSQPEFAQRMQLVRFEEMKQDPEAGLQQMFDFA
ncbi:MAG: sulfotransferase, partial [Phormidesmis sp.]